MRTILLATAALAAFVMGCSGAPSGDDTGTTSDDLSTAAASQSTYYVFTHADLRKCVWPACGGYYVARVNQATTKCADGTWASECRVLSADLSALGLSDDDAAKIDQTFQAGHVLYRGSLGTTTVNGRDVPAFTATEAWVGNALAAPQGTFYMVKDAGIRCITTPCNSTSEAKLNASAKGLIAGVDLAASGANEKQVQAGSDAIASGDGVIVAGFHDTVCGPAGRGRELVASEFYTRAQPSK